MSKKFDDVLFAAFKDGHQCGCDVGCSDDEIRELFEVWREHFSGINEIGVDQDD